MHRTRNTGFTLVELMVTIAIVAILAAIAFPSFEGSMRSNRVATTTNEMLGSLALARGEAIRSSRSSQLCASANGTACGNDWNAGWMVATDNDGNSTYEQVVRYVQGHPQMVIAGAGGASATKVLFDYRGRPDNNGANREITITPSVCPSAQQLVRTLTLNGVGQVTTLKTACP